MSNVAEKFKERTAGSLVQLFNRTAERHPFEKNEVGDAFSELSLREMTEHAQQMITEIERKLFVADLDKSKDKSLFWIRRCTGRMAHDYNEYGFAIVLFRFEGNEDMAAKLGKVYKATPVSYNEDEVSYIDKQIKVGNETGHLYLSYNHKDRYFDLSVEGYRAEYDAEAVAMLRKTLDGIEAITSQVNAAKLV